MARPLVVLDASKQHYLFQILVVGAGSNGSHFFRNLLQMIRTHLDKYNHLLDHPSFSVDITIADADKFEPKNKGNQLCDDEDMGEYKCEALADRYGEHYNIPVKRVKEYIKNMDMLYRLFSPAMEGEKIQVIPILCSMVDNNKTRQLFDTFFHSDEVRDLIYLDAGCEGVVVLDKDEKDYTPEDKERIRCSGFGGQVVCGVKMNGEVLLEPVGRIYTNILEDAHTAFPDEACSALIVNNPQRCMTNQMAAQLSSVYMNNLLHTGSIYTHYVNFNAQFGGSRPVFIQDEVIERAERIRRPVADS